MRFAAVFRHSALSADAPVARLSLREGISQLFDLQVEFVWDSADLDLEAMIWSPASVEIQELDGGEAQPFFGVVEEAEYVSKRDDRFLYRARLRPRIHGLAHRVRSRIFQDQDATEVIKKVFHDSGIPDDAVDWQLSRKYPKREFCVQYRESELSFVLRLLEDEGIFFTFRQSDSNDVLVVADDPSTFEPIEGDPILAFSTWDQADREALTDLVLSTQVCPDSYISRDWNWEKPNEPIEAQQKDERSAGLEWYEFPGGFSIGADGGRRATDRLRAGLLDKYVLEGRSNSLRLQPGRLFEVADVQPEYLARDYLIVELERHFEEHGHGNEPGYRAFFKAVPGDVEFRPRRITPRPRVLGKELAVVTGPPGEEIHVDRFGRIKVHFYWDREGKMDDRASCWIRVQQQNTAGSMILPRVGWEVDVGFLHGDPDRPVVLQKLYNRETMPPYALPDHKTQTALQSASSPGGGSTNEIRMQDGSGGMQFSIHASRNLSTVVGHDLTEEVAVDAHEDVGLALQTKVGANEKISVGVAQKITVEGNLAEETVGSAEISIGAMDEWGVGKNHSIACDGARTDSIGAVMNVLANEVTETFKSSCSRTVGAAQSLNSASDLFEMVAGSKSETVGGAKLELIRKAKQESVLASKTLNTGLLLIKAGGNLGAASKGPMAFTVGGPVVEKCGEAFSLEAKSVRILALGGAELSAGGTQLTAKGTTLKVKASSFGATGHLGLKLKGKINYQK